MPWIKNIAIGRIYVSDIQLEFRDCEPIWIDPEIYNRSPNLQNLIQSGALKVVSTYKGTGLKQDTEKKKRKTALPASSNFFPHGVAHVPKQQDLQKKRTIKILTALKKIIPEELKIEIHYIEFIPEKDFNLILEEQCKSLELIEKLYKGGIKILVNGNDVRSTKIPNMVTTYIPTVNLNNVKSNIKSEDSTGRLADAGNQLKKLKEQKPDGGKEKKNEQRKKSNAGN